MARELAIGDIHDCAAALRSVLELISPDSSDTVIFLGDYIDRGPHSFDVIETVLDLNRICTVIPLSGNHEQMIVRARSDAGKMEEWLRKGGASTLDSYARRGFTSIHELPSDHWRFFAEQTLDYWETDRLIFVHASVDPELEMADQPDFMLFWEPFGESMVHFSGKKVICGHRPQKTGVPFAFKNGVCIDTWASGGGWLTCYEPASGVCWQAKESGETRRIYIRSDGGV